MADTKISGLTELAATPAADDELVLVDKSDTTMAASGTDKRLRWDRVFFGKTAGKAADGGDTEYAFSNYKNTEHMGHANIPGGTVVGTSIVIPNVNGSVALAVASSALGAFWLDPADFAANRNTKLRLRAHLFTNAVTAVGASVVLAAHLYPVATWGGLTNAYPTIATLGASLGNVSWTGPVANTQDHKETSDIAIPGSAGWHCLAVVTSGATTAASSNSHLAVRLQYRQT